MSQRLSLICTALVAIFLGLVSKNLALAADAVDPPATKAKELPKPEEVSLTTQDKVTINAVYFGSNLGKKAVPIILLHAYKGSRADYKDLAALLQKDGHAVLVPDLRGHGKSTKEMDVSKLKKPDFQNMIYDVEACKDFLLKKNNESELNIEKLCLVGAEMGATLAIKYAAYDYHWPQLINVKQGRDVKAVVMISPEMEFKGINMKDEISNKELQGNLSIMLLVGAQNSKDMIDAKRINQQLERLHPEPSQEERAEKKDYYFKALDTNLTGAKLLGADVGAEELLGQFINVRLTKKPLTWTDRTPKI